MYKNYKYLMAAGHMCADFNQGILSSILPFLIAAHHFDYATAASLVMVSNLVGSIVQPVFGHIADKKEMPWCMAAGLLMAGGGMAMTGFTSSFFGLCVSVMIAGIGVALFHPMGALLTNRSADKSHQAAAISVFSFGGNIGYTLGPIVIAALITLWGLKATAFLIIPVAVEALFLLKNHKGITELCRIKPQTVLPENDQCSAPVLKDDWSGFFKICTVIFGRSIVFYGYNTFLALFWIDELGKTEVVANSVLTFMFAMNALSTLIGGSLADRFGNRKIVIISCIAVAPIAFLITLTSNPVLSIIMLIPVGLGLGLCHSPLVASGQNILPNHQGLASGVTLGLSVSIGGIFAPLLGIVANHYGLSATFIVIGVISIITLVTAFFLPDDRKSNISA